MAKRTNNFLSSEIDLLLDIIEKYKDVIKCKTTDAVTTAIKKRVWKAIEDDFNSGDSACFYDEKVLRTKYYNLKKEFRKKTAFNKRSLCGTGGGPPEDISIANVDMKLRDIMGGQQLEGTEAEYDCDTDNVEGNVQLTYNDEDEEMLIEKLYSPDVVVEVSVPAILNDSQPINLKSKKNKKLKVSQNTQNNTSWSKLAAIKATWTERKSRLEIKLLKREHEQKMILTYCNAKLNRTS